MVSVHAGVNERGTNIFIGKEFSIVCINGEAGMYKLPAKIHRLQSRDPIPPPRFI